jgi:hypothetical protein
VNSGKEPPVGCDKLIRYIIPYRATGILRDQSYSPIGSGRYSPPIAKKLSCKSDADHVSSWFEEKEKEKEDETETKKEKEKDY